MTEPLRVEHVIAAPPEVVFDAFTSPGGQAAFYATGEPGWIVESTCDLRVGGRWTVRFGPSRDHLFEHRNVFEVIDRPHLVVVTTHEVRPDRPAFDFRVEFSFEPHAGGTRMAVTQAGFPDDELREEHGRGVPRALRLFERAVHDGA